jgi:tRNA(Met) C34 N-acetyltransferase TmcA
MKTMNKPRFAKRAPARARRLAIDPAKPVQGQGIGTATLADDFDASEPAFRETDWKHNREE